MGMGLLEGNGSLLSMSGDPLGGAGGADVRGLGGG